MTPPSGVYPARWQGPSRPIVATFHRGARQLHLVTCHDRSADVLNLTVHPLMAASRSAEIVRAAVGLYGETRIRAALDLPRDIPLAPWCQPTHNPKETP